MDVHPPHEPIHSWRDFLLHLATITVGLLIALGLEAGVENMHHRHVVEVARENIRNEISQNKSRGVKNIASVKTNADNVKANLQKIRDLRANTHALDHGEMHFDFRWDTFNESAWLSARDSGALTYMPPAEVQEYADVYEQQQLVNTRATNIFIQETQLLAPLIMEKNPADLSKEDIHDLLHGTAIADIDLVTLNQIIEQLDQSYDAALKR